MHAGTYKAPVYDTRGTVAPPDTVMAPVGATVAPPWHPYFLACTSLLLYVVCEATL